MSGNGKRASRKFIIALIIIGLCFGVVLYGLMEISEGSGAEGGKAITDTEHLANIVQKALEIIAYMGLGYVASNVLQKFSELKNLWTKQGE